MNDDEQLNTEADRVALNDSLSHNERADAAVEGFKQQNQLEQQTQQDQEAQQDQQNQLEQYGQQTQQDQQVQQGQGDRQELPTAIYAPPVNTAVLHETPPSDPQELQEQQAPKEPKSKNRGGVLLLSGLLIGGLIGGVSGGVVAANVVGNNTGSASTGVSAVKISNPDTATVVSAVAAQRVESVVTLQVRGQRSGGSGSGVVYSRDGYIVTNAHVVLAEPGNMRPDITVRFADGKLLKGELVGVDPLADLAVVKVKADNLKPIPLADSNATNVGDVTVAIGAPLELNSTVTSGVVSAVNRGISVANSLVEDGRRAPEDNGDSERNSPFDFYLQPPPEQQQTPRADASRVTLPVIQTDASINPGNSGGALLNTEGELIGINVAIASTRSSETTAGSVGLGFAIPANLVKRVVDGLIAGEKPTHGLLGASVSDAAQTQGATHAGGYVAEVVPDSAAAKAGIRAGDVITAVEGIPAADGTAVSALVRMHPGGAELNLTVLRNGKPQDVKVTLGTL
nr:trypsin-like peptidase domain-containing protein [Canibacter zhoujuaniae]